MLNRPDDRDLEHGAEHEGDRERRREGRPVREAVQHQLVGDVCREHRELALREVDDVRRAVDEDECQREAAVHRAERDALDGVLGEVLALQAADEQEDRDAEEDQYDRGSAGVDRAAAEPFEPGGRGGDHQYPR